MTCIAGVVHEGKVWMGADSCGSDGHRYHIFPHSKLFQIGPDEQRLLIAITGAFGIADYMRFRANVTARNERTQDLDRWVRTSLVDAIRAAALQAGGLHAENGVETIDGWILIATEGRIFVVQQSLHVLEAPVWGYAAGSGMDVANGSLWTTRDSKLSPKQRILKALEAAEAVITTVRGPFEVKSL